MTKMTGIIQEITNQVTKKISTELLKPRVFAHSVINLEIINN